MTHAIAHLCQYFPEFGASLRHAERTVSAWRALAHGTGPGMRRDALRLAAFITRHPHAARAGGRFLAVYFDCNPDA
jgi:hypothetical protein